jgi:mannose-6-phosphate isomerase-like protein (cupin superfamily)
MAYLINLPTFKDSRGSLTVVEKLLPFEIKRLYYIYNVTDKRGGHRHKNNVQALICLSGTCKVHINNGIKNGIFVLDKPEKCLIVEAKDWHTMDKFSKGSSLLVLSSEYYDKNDYIVEKYPE